MQTIEQSIDKVKKIVKKVAKTSIDINSINDDSSLSDELMFDSVMIIELLLEIENEFSIRFDDEKIDFEAFDSVSGIVKMILDAEYL